MTETMLLDPVQVLVASDQPLQVGSAALFEDDRLIALGEEARQRAAERGVSGHNRAQQLLAPCLVDPHSSLPSPFTGSGETLKTLINSAGRAGYGQLALLPNGESERDSPERLKGFQPSDCDLKIHLWGSFTHHGEGERLSLHADLLEAGAIGLSAGEQMPSANLIDRALLLGEMDGAPVLIAPNDSNLRGDGMIREGVETLRAGWPADPTISETLPMGQLLELQRRHSNRKLVLMNLSTAAGVEMLSHATSPPLATVSWWHLVQDRSSQPAEATHWFVTPSIGGQRDRWALIQALGEGKINAVAVHGIPLDDEECLLPPDQRPKGLSGHHLVLPTLWQHLVVDLNWSVNQLWQALSFGPARLLGQEEERLSIGSNRWLLFDPDQIWDQTRAAPQAPKAANQPWLGVRMRGQVVSCGLRIPTNQVD